MVTGVFKGWDHNNTVVSHKYAPLFCMLASSKTGEGRGLMRRIGMFPGDDHYKVSFDMTYSYGF